jgi:hypothetical protein
VLLSLADDGFVTRSEFDTLFQAILPKAKPGSSARAFAALDLEGNGKVDIVSWSHRIRLADMPAMVARIRRHGEGGSQLTASAEDQHSSVMLLLGRWRHTVLIVQLLALPNGRLP